MTTHARTDTGHGRDPQTHHLRQASAETSRWPHRAWYYLQKQWRHDATWRWAFAAAITVLGTWALAKARSYTPGWAETGAQILATVVDPVQLYIVAHTQALPITADTAYNLWKSVGLAAFALGFLRNGPARLTWTLWGAATVLMVWIESPEPSRHVAAAVALLAWSALSCLALRGLRLRTGTFVNIDVHAEAPPAPDVEVHAEIRMPPHEPTTYLPYPLPYLPPSPN